MPLNEAREHIAKKSSPAVKPFGEDQGLFYIAHTEESEL